LKKEIFRESQFNSIFTGVKIPLNAIIDEERVFGPEISPETWAELKKRQKKGSIVTMECCHQPGFLRKTKETQHFYHQAKHPDCSWKDESPEHERLKYQIYKICKAEGWEAETEYRSKAGDWIVDILAKKDDRIIAIEVQLSKITLTELEDRERKYQEQHVESYWILKNYLGCEGVNYLDELVKDKDLLTYFDLLENSDLMVKLENYFYICKNILTVGLNPQSQTLYTSDEPALQLEDWVKSVLNTEYKQKMEGRSEMFFQKTGYTPKFLVTLNEIYQFKLRLDKYKFKINSRSNSSYDCKFKPELDAALRCHYALESVYRAIMADEKMFFSSRNGKIGFRLISHSQLEFIGQLFERIPPLEEQMLESLLELDKKIIQSSRRL